jgi:uncharacterized protein with GYD domain
MPRYIALLKLTDQGRKNIKKSIARARNFDKLAAKSGVQVEGQYWTTGRFDGVLILKAEKEQQILSVLGELAALGNVRTETMQAFVDTDFEALVK